MLCVTCRCEDTGAGANKYKCRNVIIRLPERPFIQTIICTCGGRLRQGIAYCTAAPGETRNPEQVPMRSLTEWGEVNTKGAIRKGAIRYATRYLRQHGAYDSRAIIIRPSTGTNLNTVAAGGRHAAGCRWADVSTVAGAGAGTSVAGDGSPRCQTSRLVAVLRLAVSVLSLPVSCNWCTASKVVMVRAR